MKKPLLEEMTAYCLTHHPKVDPMDVWLHYESNGWMVGKVRMKNWKAAIANWDRMRDRFNGGSNGREQAFAAALDRSREADREDESLLKFPARSGARVPQSIRPHDRGMRHISGQFRFNESD